MAKGKKEIENPKVFVKHTGEIEFGYYNCCRYKKGAVFPLINPEKDFSSRWMVQCDRDGSNEVRNEDGSPVKPGEKPVGNYQTPREAEAQPEPKRADSAQSASNQNVI